MPTRFGWKTQTVSTHTERQPAAVLAEAAEAAGRAPSIHNTQPWRWHVAGDTMDLHVDRTRTLPITDPDDRMLLISCGTALHHARTALAAQGYADVVELLPDPDDLDHLARLTLNDPIPVTPEAMRLVQAMDRRHTDRRPTSETPPTRDQIEALRAAATGQGVDLHKFTPNQLTDLIVAVSRAEDIAAADPALRAETAYWRSPDRPPGTGLPADVIPDSRPQTDVGERDFGGPGTLEVGEEHDKHAAYVVLFSAGDDPLAWLYAGQALSAVWLTATDLGLAVLPFSQVVEVDATRSLMRQMLAGLGYAHIVLRIGVADPDAAGPGRTPRLPATQTITIQDFY